tara:strand:+ start:189 stop:362 length:174 start_codon:yes stop_codon:yes gene_type:complete
MGKTLKRLECHLKLPTQAEEIVRRFTGCRFLFILYISQQKKKTQHSGGVGSILCFPE